MRTWPITSLHHQTCFEDQDRAERRLAEAKAFVARKERELNDAKVWLQQCEAWLAEFND